MQQRSSSTVAALGTWSYFAASIDFSTGSVVLYHHPHQQNVAEYKENFTIATTQLGVNQLIQFISSSVEPNVHFTPNNAFLGDLAYVEVGMFFTNNVEYL